MRGAAAPLSIPSLVKTLRLEPSVTGGGMLATIIEELVAEGAVQGALKGGGSNWTPAVYSRTQQDAVLNFYRRAPVASTPSTRISRARITWDMTMTYAGTRQPACGVFRLSYRDTVSDRT